MGVFHGKNGEVEFNSLAVGEVTAWSYSEKAELADATAMGDTTKTYKTGVTDGSGSVTCRMSVVEAGGVQDTGQADVDTGDEVEVTLYPAGNTSTYTKFTGNVVVTGIDRGADLGSVGEFTFTFQGGLTQGVVA